MLAALLRTLSRGQPHQLGRPGRAGRAQQQGEVGVQVVGGPLATLGALPAVLAAPDDDIGVVGVEQCTRAGVGRRRGRAVRRGRAGARPGRPRGRPGGWRPRPAPGDGWSEHVVGEGVRAAGELGVGDRRRRADERGAAAVRARGRAGPRARTRSGASRMSREDHHRVRRHRTVTVAPGTGTSAPRDPADQHRPVGQQVSVTAASWP